MAEVADAYQSLSHANSARAGAHCVMAQVALRTIVLLFLYARAATRGSQSMGCHSARGPLDGRPGEKAGGRSAAAGGVRRALTAPDSHVSIFGPAAVWCGSAATLLLSRRRMHAYTDVRPVRAVSLYARARPSRMLGCPVACSMWVIFCVVCCNAHRFLLPPPHISTLQEEVWFRGYRSTCAVVQQAVR